MNMRAFIALAAAVGIFHSASAAVAADSLEIPTILPMTGPAAFLGKEFSETLRLVEDRTNKTGGIKGRPIHFAVQDDQSSPQVAVQLTNAALAKNPTVIIQGGPLALCKSTAPLIPGGLLMWCLSPSMRPDAGSSVYTVTASSRDCLIAGLNYFKSRGFKRIGVLNGTDATGADADDLLAEIIKLPQFAGMSFVDSEHFNLADLSVAAQISRIKAAGSQAMIAYTTGTQVATVLHGMTDAGLDIPVLTSNGNMSVAQLDGYKSFAPKELLFPAYPALTADPSPDKGVQQKIAVFKADLKGANMTADMLHAIPWDPALLTVEAFRRAGADATTQQIRDVLASVVNYPGVLGRYDFRAIPNRGIGLNALNVVKWDAARSIWVIVSKAGG